MSALVVTPTTKTIGAEVTGIEPDDLLQDESIVATVMDALEENGVLVFRDLDLDPETQVAFCQRIGELDYSEGHHPVAGIYRVTRDATKNSSAEYLKGTFHWHIDGCTPLHGEPPQKATVLSAKAVAESGGETQFASTYAAYDALTDDEKERFRLAESPPFSRSVAAAGLPRPHARTDTGLAGQADVGPPPGVDASNRGASHCSSVPMQTTSWTWSPMRVEHCSTSSWTEPRRTSSCTATTGPSETPSSGTTRV